MPVTVVAILAIVAIILAVIALFPAANSYPLTNVAVLLLGIALLLIGYGGR